MTLSGILLVESIRIGGSNVSRDDDMIGESYAEKAQFFGPSDEADQLFGFDSRIRDSEVKAIVHRNPLESRLRYCTVSLASFRAIPSRELIQNSRPRPSD